MERKLETLYDLCETVYKELEAANEKIKTSGGDVTGGDVEFLDRLTHIMKSLKTTIAMMESEMFEEGNSGYYYGGRYFYDGESMEGGRGGSYARGGGGRGGNSNARGGSYARGGGGRGGRSNARGGSYARGGRGYSRDDAREDFIEEIEELMEKAPDERTRMKFERMLEEMK